MEADTGVLSNPCGAHTHGTKGRHYLEQHDSECFAQELVFDLFAVRLDDDALLPA